MFAAVAEEAGRLLPVDAASMCRYEPDGTVTFVAAWGRAVDQFPVGSRWTLGGHNISTLVSETGRPARVDGYADNVSARSATASARRASARRSGAPIIVEGRLWGVIGAGSTLEQPLPADTEARLASFTELVATAIANAESRAELAASRRADRRRRDETRRRIERDLHDGTQQRLVSLGLQRASRRRVAPPARRARELSCPASLRRLAGVVTDCGRSRAASTRRSCPSGGLGPALKTLARRSACRSTWTFTAWRGCPSRSRWRRTTSVSEALANAAKHAHASAVEVSIGAARRCPAASVRDDGAGGADPAEARVWSGSRTASRRSAARSSVHSATGAGTGITVDSAGEAEPAHGAG